MSGGNLSSWWNREEMMVLLRAWEQVLPPPRARDHLSSRERLALHARFEELAGETRRNPASVARQFGRLVAAYQLISAVTIERRAAGKCGWFDLPRPQQDEVRRARAGKMGMTTLDRELFREIARVCNGDPSLADSVEGESVPPPTPPRQASPQPNKRHRKARKASQKKIRLDDSASEGEDEVDELVQERVPKAKWVKSDWLLFIQAWREAVDSFVTYGNATNERAKLPNWLIRQRWVSIGGSEETTVASITAKKRCVLAAHQFVRDCLAALAANNQPRGDWFELSFNQRFRLQRDLIGPRSSQRLGCDMDEATFDLVTSIIDKETVLSSVTAPSKRVDLTDGDDSDMSPSIEAELNRRKQQSVIVMGPTARSQPRSRPSSATHRRYQHRDSDRMATSQRSFQSPRRSYEVASDDQDARYASTSDDEESEENRYLATERHHQSITDNGVIAALIDNQQRRFQQALDSLREERVREREQNHAFLIELVKQRVPEDNREHVSFLKALAERQSQQFVDLFGQLQKARQHERDQFRALLRRLHPRPSRDTNVERAMGNWPAAAPTSRTASGQ